MTQPMFYTSVVRFGNNILFRGYGQNGKRIQTKVPFKPTLYVQSDKKQSGWKSIDGTNVEPMTFDSMKERQNSKDDTKTSPTLKSTG